MFAHQGVTPGTNFCKLSGGEIFLGILGKMASNTYKALKHGSYENTLSFEPDGFPSGEDCVHGTTQILILQAIIRQQRVISRSLLADKDRNIHSKSSPNIITRALRETLQKYIDSERKDFIKAGSLDQYLQQFQAYNIALDETSSMIESISSQPQQPTLVNSAISQQSNNFSNYLIPNFYSIPDDVEMEDLFTIDKEKRGGSGNIKRSAPQRWYTTIKTNIFPSSVN
ncbi:3939_t:CDS:2 [Funneliformis mosseae]|uniref:3939_t:CDS:1 n=1 Tax=Funneliformis mosseae TaxID=27381 RepID=A0A9N9DB98_FUNMO|nr:3939_t:CDS:2 [Funneliformis mosseae]